MKQDTCRYPLFCLSSFPSYLKKSCCLGCFFFLLQTLGRLPPLLLNKPLLVRLLLLFSKLSRFLLIMHIKRTIYYGT